MLLADRFWRHVEKSDGCWLWTGVTFDGYGRFDMTPPGQSRGRPVLAHRVAWEFSHGPIPRGLIVCHRCDTPGCVRPDHLFVGTIADNNKDAAAKKRFSTPAHREAARRNVAKATAARLAYKRPYSAERRAQAAIAAASARAAKASMCQLAVARWEAEMDAKEAGR